MRPPLFHVVPAGAVAEILADEQRRVIALVREVYLAHERGDTVNPQSSFLRFPHQPDNRVIALPASLGGPEPSVGIKWIASFPRNVDDGLARASAVLVLNDHHTGYPIACLEAAGISAARTAASAALAATVLVDDPRPRRVSVVGCGLIARTVLAYLHAAGFPVSDVTCFDREPARAARLAAIGEDLGVVPHLAAATLDEAISRDVVVFATTAATPYVGPETKLAAGQLVLNISLRDLAPELLLRANNVVDDVDHCLRAATSPHLAEELSGSRDFVGGTLGALLAGDVTLPADRPTIFSPFGLGVLDIGVGAFVYAEARRRNTAIAVPDFFGGQGGRT